MNKTKNIPHTSADGEKIYQFTINPRNERSNYTWMLRFSAGARSILEIGCSTGFFSKFLIEGGARVVGVEINPSAAKIAAAVCERVIVGDIENDAIWKEVNERFDAVVMGDVLEHLRDPGKVLSAIRQYALNPGGFVVISTPNSAHWVFRREILAGRFPRRQFGIFDSTHLQFFTKSTLETIILSSGYQVTSLRYSVNFNSVDITFGLLAPFYKNMILRGMLIRFEELLSKVFPTLFGYQFILRIEPLL